MEIVQSLPSPPQTLHHTLFRCRVRMLTRYHFWRGRLEARLICAQLHRNYHTVFGHQMAQEAAKRLRRWTKQRKYRPHERPFYAVFTGNQHLAFTDLFGFPPEELHVNGNLGNALRVIQDRRTFYPSKEAEEKLSLALERARTKLY